MRSTTPVNSRAGARLSRREYFSSRKTNNSSPSSTRTSSTVSSPDVGSDCDSPYTPPHYPNRRGTSTPDTEYSPSENDESSSLSARSSNQNRGRGRSNPNQILFPKETARDKNTKLEDESAFEQQHKASSDSKPSLTGPISKNPNNGTVDASLSDHAKCSVKTEQSEEKTSSQTSSLSDTDFKKWKYLFPTTLRYSIQNTNDKCICENFRGEHARCSHVVKAKGRVFDIEKILQLLQRFRRRANYDGLFAEIAHLIEVFICGNNHKSSAQNILDKLKAPENNSTESDREYIKPYLWWLEDSLKSKALVVKLETKPSTLQDIPATTNKVSVPIPPAFQPYQPKEFLRSSPFTALSSVITKPLTSTDEKDGYIYIFLEVGTIGPIKVGWTKDLDERLKNWNRACQRQFEYHPGTKNGELPWIPHVSRVERLIHTELKDYRKKRRCGACNCNHIEWFDVDAKHVVKVFEKWRNWILQNPYEEDEPVGPWSPKVVAEVCKPIPFS